MDKKRFTLETYDADGLLRGTGGADDTRDYHVKSVAASANRRTVVVINNAVEGPYRVQAIYINGQAKY